MPIVVAELLINQDRFRKGLSSAPTAKPPTLIAIANNRKEKKSRLISLI